MNGGWKLDRVKEPGAGRGGLNWAASTYGSRAPGLVNLALELCDPVSSDARGVANEGLVDRARGPGGAGALPRADSSRGASC